MSETPNIANFDEYRAKVDAALLSNNAEIDLHKENPNLISLDEVRARRLAQESFANTPEIDPVQLEIQNITRTGAVIAYVRQQEQEQVVGENIAPIINLNAYRASQNPQSNSDQEAA